MVSYLIFVILLCLDCFVGAANVQSEVDMVIKKDSSSDTVLLKAGTVLTMDRGETLYAMPNGGLPFFIMNPLSDDSKITLAAGDVQTMVQAQLSENIGKGVNEVIGALRKAETLMSKKDFTQALNVLGPIKEKHPRVAEIYFLSASLHFLTKNSSAAIEDLQKGLIISPEDPTAKKLLESIQGKKQ